jgi:penicillin-binding protein 2
VFERRLRIVAIFGGLYLLAILARLFQMQVLDAEEWKLEAAGLARRSIRLASRRGSILDRHGRILAADRLEHDLNVRLDRKDDGSWRCRGCGQILHTEFKKPPRRCRACGGREFTEGEPVDLTALPGLLSITWEDFRARLASSEEEYRRAVEVEVAWRLKQWERADRRDVERLLLRREFRFFENAPEDAVREVVLHPDRYWGLLVRANRRRFRLDEPAIRGIVGTVAKLDREEAARVREREKISYSEIYRIRAGRSGIEKALEERLGSREGRKVVERNRRGEVSKVLFERPARDGRDVTITLDLELQKFLLEELKRTCAEHGANSAAFAAVDPATGEVLALVGYEGREDQKVWNPAITRAVPGSVYKVVTAIAALESGPETFDPAKTFSCQAGKWHRIGCSHIHGNTNLVESLVGSCNKYFANLAEQVGIDDMARWGKKLGFGATTGIEVTLENPGIVPDRSWKARMYERDPEYWKDPGIQRGDVWQIGFGCGALLVTPIQVARFMAILANGGRFVTPSLVVGEGRIGEQVVSARTLRIVGEGMRGVVTRGTAAGNGLDRYRVAGKTGTAEIVVGQKKHISWFAGYAPAEKPVVAFACMVRNTPSYGADAASPVVLAFLEKVLGR